MIFKKNQLSSRFKQVFHNTGFGIMIVDKNRDLIEVNPKFCDMLGYNKEELIGQNAEILHISNKSYKEFGEKAFNQVRNKKPVNLDWPFRKKNREKKKFSSGCSSCFSSNGFWHYFDNLIAISSIFK